MEFDQTTTAAAFLGLVVLGSLALLASPMQASTIAMMVVPSMLVFGGICLFIGVKHGEHRAGA
jgi:hypothetical protein